MIFYIFDLIRCMFSRMQANITNKKRKSDSRLMFYQWRQSTAQPLTTMALVPNTNIAFCSLRLAQLLVHLPEGRAFLL